MKFSFRFIFENELLKTTSTISFSNQNDEPETRRFVFNLEKKENETTKHRFFHRFQKRCPALNLGVSVAKGTQHMFLKGVIWSLHMEIID